MNHKKRKKLDHLVKRFERDKLLHSGGLWIQSNKHDIQYDYTYSKEQFHNQNPFYMASVGKIFTATLIGILKEKSKLSFNDSIDKYIDTNLVNGLHVLNGIDSSNDITIQHLLTHRSGLDDAFWPLLNQLKQNPERRFKPSELIDFVKNNTSPKYSVGKKVHYADTNYYLLGLIIENVTQKTFAESMHEYIFTPLKMNNSYLLHRSKPAIKTPKVVPFKVNDVQGDKVEGYGDIDYAGGSVVSTINDLFIFMRALKSEEIVGKEILSSMIEDTYVMYPGIHYGYGTWTIKPVPLIIPKKYEAWGVIGILGSFMFYHPITDSIIIGTFNNDQYEKKCVRFVMKAIRLLNN